MLLIRLTQLDSLEQKARKDFVEEMVAHLRDIDGDHTMNLSNEDLEIFIHTGVAAAKHYNWRLQGSVRFYLEMMAHFGSRFDCDPKFTWASSILRERFDDELDHADTLHAELMERWPALKGNTDDATG